MKSHNISSKDTVIVFTGAGISADSGVKTFRDNGGLWYGHRVDDVAHPNGFKKDPQKVWNFYKTRHDELEDIQPNEAHYAVAKLQEKVHDLGLNFILVTQNVDRLHQSAGTTDVLELHGNLTDVKCSQCDFIDHSEFFWQFSDIPHCPVCGEHLRPNVVWFSEIPNGEAFYTARDATERCHSILVVGSSCVVQPAASIVSYARNFGADVYECNLESAVGHDSMMDNSVFFRGKAKVTVPLACDRIYNSLLSKRTKPI